jgi:outer membrane immunogenic protein
MKKILIATVLAALGSSSALAADLAPRTYTKAPAYDPATNWTGFYIGANGGWGWSNFDTAATPFGVTAIGEITPQSLGTKTSGAVFGGQLGYNWQAASWVIGVEGDFDGASISGTQQSAFKSLIGPAGAADSFSATSKINWLASVRGRVGYTWGASLLYVTGGAAWKNSTINSTVSALVLPAAYEGSAAGAFSQTTSGWVIGAGYEWMMQSHWTVRGEYLFYDFKGSDGNSLSIPSCAVAACGVNVSTSKNDVSAFRLGVNYKFGG